MRRFLICLLGVTALLVYGCSKEEATAPPAPGTQNDPGLSADAQAIAWDMVTQAGWPAEDEAGAARPVEQCHGQQCPLLDFERTVLAGDIAHYSVRIHTGPGEYDQIGIHRVVRETQPWRPIRTRKSVFLQHGDLKDFTGMFLPGAASPRQPDDVGLAFQLAASNIDVWGIDQAWTLVPDGLPDYGFLLDFGMDRCIADLGLAVEVGRVVRLLTGNGYRQMALLGYSSGAALGFAYLNAESQLPHGHQKICAYIPVDYGLKTDNEAWIEGCRLDYQYYDAVIQSGYNRIDNPFVFFGPPALEDPEGPSALIPGLTNSQAAIALAAYPGYPSIPGYSYHFLAGVFEEGLPVGLQYTQFNNWVDFMIAAPPNETAAFPRDCVLAILPEYNVPWDDHLGDITTPILYISAAGGAGPYGRHTLDLISSTDVTVLNFSFHLPEEVLLDFAHIDLFLADGAESFVWTPARDWILSHTP
jgi:hypothetical protein